jgi:hypothetical protein
VNDFSSRNGLLVTIEALRPGSTVDLIVYLGVTSIGPTEIVVQIKSFLERHPRKVESICLVAPKFREAMVAKVVECDDFVLLKAGLGVESHACLFERDGKIAGIDAIDTHQLPRMLTRILTEIVRSRYGVLGASAAVHYAKPSRDHSDQFIRAGNVLVNSVEVEMIAWGCLPHIPDDVTFIYTDTGAINVVAYAVRDLLNGFGKVTVFSVDSFGSYKGLETFAGTRDGSIWLISGTTSGNLARKIIERQRVARHQIVTLFSLGAPSESSVCHLDHDAQHNPSGLPRIRSYPPNNCALCRAGSSPLWLTDEHFLVSDMAVTPYLPKRDDLSEETLTALHQFAGQNVFRVFFQPNQNTERSDIFLDLEPHSGGLLATAPTALVELAERFRCRVQQSLPAAVDVIVHLDDPASHALASAIRAHISQRGLKPTQIASSKLSAHLFQSPPESVVVVACTVASGTSVIDLSRTLRLREAVKSVSYIVLVDRSVTEERAKQTHQSVTITEDGHRYDYHVIVRLPLPDPAAIITNSWDEEIQLLQQLLESPSDDIPITPLRDRLDLLDKARDRRQRGLAEKLFWPSEDGCQLKLSPKFVFIPTDFDTTKVSQADVYSIVRCLLHSLRTKGRDGKGPPLSQHPLHRKVLDVGVFYRFNDPVLQAALLRSATPAELDYSISDIGNQSTNARLLLSRLFKDPLAPVIEFALALAVGRLRITEADKALVLAEIDEFRPPLGTVASAFLNVWRSR